MPLSRRLILAAAVLPAPALATREVFQLVTPEEALAGRETGRAFTGQLRSLNAAGVPAIEVIEPREAPTLPSPLTIRLRFRAPEGAQINPNSFRASYGALGLDITSRLMQHARVDANGLELRNVAIPAGSHRIVLRVADTAGRTGERTFRFTIA